MCEINLKLIVLDLLNLIQEAEKKLLILKERDYIKNINDEEEEWKKILIENMLYNDIGELKRYLEKF